MVIVVSSCNSTNSNDRFCTAIFLGSAVSVLTPDGNLADSVQVRITIGNGESFDPCTRTLGDYCDQQGPGKYIIFHDGIRDEIDEGENAAVLVEGTRGELSFTREFVFTNDGCHVAKVSGPDTVRLQANLSTVQFELVRCCLYF